MRILPIRGSAMRCRRWFGSLLLPYFVALACFFGVARGAEPIALTAGDAPGVLTRVEATLEVGGHLKLINDGKSVSVPMAVTAKLAYDEQRLEPANDGQARSLRYYDRAEATLKIDDGGLKPTFRDARRLVV